MKTIIPVDFLFLGFISLIVQLMRHFYIIETTRDQSMVVVLMARDLGDCSLTLTKRKKKACESLEKDTKIKAIMGFPHWLFATPKKERKRA